MNLDAALDSDDSRGTHPWSGEEESRGESPRRVRELDGTSTDWESAEEGSSSGTEGIASTGTGDSGAPSSRAGLLTSSTPIDSWEVVFHAKKIGIQFKQGRGGRIVVSKLSELVLFGPQRMPRVGAVLVACNDQLLHGLSWRQVAQHLKATGRPLKLRFTEDAMGDDAPPPPMPPFAALDSTPENLPTGVGLDDPPASAHQGDLNRV